jgi:hypothetical protein
LQPDSEAEKKGEPQGNHYLKLLGKIFIVSGGFLLLQAIL